MITVFLALALALFLAAPVQADDDHIHFRHDDESTTETTVDVKKGERIELQNHNGDVDIHVWKQNRIRIVAGHSGGVAIRVGKSGPVRRIKAEYVKGYHGDTGGLPNVDYHITIPIWIPIDITGVNTDVSVDGSEGEIAVNTVNGDVWVDGGTGLINLTSVNGGVELSGARGRVYANSVNDDVSLENIVGSVFGEAVNGDIVMRTITADTIRSTTVRGDVLFEGKIGHQGHYWFSTHEGDVMILVPKTTDATVGFFTYHGELFTSFPITIPRLESKSTKGQRVTFQLGNGEAHIDLETFSGDIEIDWLDEIDSR